VHIYLSDVFVTEPTVCALENSKALDLILNFYTLSKDYSNRLRKNFEANPLVVRALVVLFARPQYPWFTNGVSESRLQLTLLCILKTKQEHIQSIYLVAQAARMRRSLKNSSTLQKHVWK